MSKVLTDKKLIDKFLERGVENIFPTKDALRQKLMSGERIRAYQGFDPTGPYLHIGHAMGIRALRILQQLGHEVVFLVGDFTSKVGDPDKETGRKIMTDEEVAQNMAGWKEQAAQLIDFDDKQNPVQFGHNFEWLSKLKLHDLIELMSHMTVQQMLERDMFERRMKKGDPIGVQEFIYPLMQGYDSVAMEVDLEIGGTDQTFNMLVGRTLVKAYLKKEKFVRTNKLMESPDGTIMSKTKGNGINLSDAAEEMYGKAMSYGDEFIVRSLDLLTEVDQEKIKEIEQALKKGENPVEFKKFMAFEIVKTIRGEQEAKKAQDEFTKVFQKGEKPSDVPKIAIGEISPETLVEIGAADSRGGARRLMEQGAVKLNDKKNTDWQKPVKLKKGDVIQIGPRKFYEVN